MRHHHHTRGQAIVEFALSATLIFLLLAAAVDLGLLFFTKQSITSAAQEGATYGSRWLIDNASGARALNVAEIRSRVRYESGTNGGNNISNLTDLNSDGIDDSTQAGMIDSHIIVRAVADNNMDGNPINDGPADCTNPATSTVPCYVLVTVSKVHEMFFPFSPAFGKEVTVTSSYYMLIRDSYRTNVSALPTFEQPTAPPDPNNIVIDLSGIPSTFPNAALQTRWTVTAYDKTVGTSNGAGIDHVFVRVRYPNTTIHTFDDYNTPYCVWSGGNCAVMPDFSPTKTVTGIYLIEVTAYATNGTSRSVSASVTR